MPTELIGTLIGKFEKNELYTFLTGCTVSLAVVIYSIDTKIFNADMPMIFFRFVFLFIFSTACIYATYTLFVYIFFFILRHIFSEKNKIGKWCLKKYEKQKVLYLPAYAQLQEGRHILILITMGLSFIFPFIKTIIPVGSYSYWLFLIYKIVVFFLFFLSARALFSEYIYDLCVREKVIQITNDQKQYIEWLNSPKTN